MPDWELLRLPMKSAWIVMVPVKNLILSFPPITFPRIFSLMTVAAVTIVSRFKWVMSMSNQKAHMHPKDRIRQLALETQTLPGWGLNDKAFHASQSVNRAYFDRSAQVHASIKTHYLNHGHTVEQWSIVTADVRLFNRAWNQMHGLPPDDMPPPKSYRSVLPLDLSIPF